MKAISTPFMAAAGAGLMLAMSAAALAGQSENDALQIRKAKITLARAVSIAEAKAGGHASKAEFEKAAEGWVFDVEVVGSTAVSDVHVDAETGAVMSVAEDKIDNDDEDQDPAD